MMRQRKRPLVVMAGMLAVSAAAARADFTYEETTQITGGSIVGMVKMMSVFSKQARQLNDPILSTVSIKGNRMTRADKLHSEIVDLDANTITVVDHTKRQYTTMTFEQMRQQIEAAMAKAKAEQAKQGAQPAGTSDAPSTVDMSFNVKVRNTGASKEVTGLTANESILSMTVDAKDKQSGQTGSLAITNDMYMAPEVPGYDEVREFYKRYAVKMGTVVNGSMRPQIMAMMQQPGAGKGMAEMAEEISKLKGIPVLQIMRVGTTLDGTPLPAASELALPTGPPPPSASDVAKAAVMSSLPFGGFGRKKKPEEAPASDAAAQAAAAVLMEMKTQTTSFSQASVDTAIFTPPAGYQKVEPRQIE